MNISSKGLDLIKEFEGFSAEPYLCPGGIPTIGYGNTYYGDGTKVSLEDKSITKDYAECMLEKSINDVYSKCVNDNAPRTQMQRRFDALVSFTYNLGCGNLKSSTLLKKHNLGDFIGAEKEFIRWNKAGGKVLAGLTRRREAESKLYKG